LTLTRCDRLRWNFAHLYRRSSNLRFDERDEKARRGCMFLEKSSRRNDRRQSRERALQNHHYHLAHTHTHTHTHTHPVSLFPHSFHPATPSLVLFLYAKRDLSSLVFVNGFRVRARAPLILLLYIPKKKKYIKAIRTRTRAAINWLASKSRMNVKDW